MFDSLQKKLENFYLFAYQAQMPKKIPYDQKKALKVQNKKLHKLVKCAYEIPFYKERFDRVGVKPKDIKTQEDLLKLPLLTKDELRKWMKEEAKNPKYKDWYRDTTSGSSGVPLMILFSPREKAYMKANWFRVLQVAGYNPFTGKTMSRLNAHDAKEGPDTIMQKFGILRRKLVNQYAKESEVVRQINAYKPDLLYMNKTEFMRVCLWCSQNNKKMWHPHFYIPISERVDDAARKLFMEVMGPNIIDSYGTAETGACMVRLFQDDFYSIHQDSFAVNIIDEADKPADEGRIIVTPLYKTDLPLINYVVGDQVVSEVRNGVRVVTDIKGRMNDVFKYRTGEVTTFFEVTPVIAHCDDIIQVRFIQESYDKVVIQCVHNEAESKRTKEEVEKDVSSQLQAIFKHPFELEFHWMKVIPPDPNGKLRMIVCNVK